MIRSNTKKTRAQKLSKPSTGLKSQNSRLRRYLWPRQWWRRALVLLAAFVILFTGGMYGVARWYIAKHADEPLTFGATFIPDYARSLNLDPEQTMQALIDDLGLKRFRLVSYWKNHEPFPDVYNFSELDWQFEKAEAAGAKISLAIGLRQPRWPECHEPDWANDRPIEIWYPQLKEYIAKVIERYGNHPALESYQLENEFFLDAFGDCPDHSRWRLEDEYKLVKQLDPNTPVVVSRSNNSIGLPIGAPRPDQSAVSVYKRVWEPTLKRYFEYPQPAWFYASLAGSTELFTNRDMFIHELQAEAWLPPGYYMGDAPIELLYKSMNPDRLEDRINYGVATGMRTIDLWGVEWWYQMKSQRGAPELWQTAKSELAKYQNF